MKFSDLSYQLQIFVISIFLVTIPMLVLSIVVSDNSLRQMDAKYQDALKDLTTQTNLNIDQLVKTAEKIGTIHILNDDVKRALTTDFSSNTSAFPQYDKLMKAQISQANQLNTNVVTSIFINQHGYVFDYNFYGYSNFRAVFDDIDLWAEYARNDNHSTYVAPIQTTSESHVSYKNILPLVMILKDPDTFKEIGIVGIGINFKSIVNILSSSELPNSKMMLFNQDNQLLYSSDESFFYEQNNNHMIQELEKISSRIDLSNTEISSQVKLGSDIYTVNGAYNQTTGWKIVHLLDNSIVVDASEASLQNFFIIFIIMLMLGFLMALFISRQFSNSINSLCRQIDQCEDRTIHWVNLSRTKLHNKEFLKIVNSYNQLNHRLMDSLQENYTIQLNEKQMKLKMLQAQINPHFLYNTLNLISSIANIHDIPEIRIISTSISELLRYNLKSGPIVKLQEETEQIQRYMSIQQIRFPDKFIYECALPDELKDVTIPVFILQPLVENAVLHGLDEKESDGYVMLNIFSEHDHVHILVADNGVGMNPETLEKLRNSLKDNIVSEISAESYRSIGVINVHQRIQSLCGKEYGISIDSVVGQGTVVDIDLPLTYHLEVPM